MSETATVRKPSQGGFSTMLIGYMHVSSDGDRQVLDIWQTGRRMSEYHDGMRLLRDVPEVIRKAA